MKKPILKIFSNDFKASSTLCFLLLLCNLSAFGQIDTTNLAGLRSLTSANSSGLYFLSNPGMQGIWKYDPNDKVSPDNTGTVIVSSNGLRFRRLKSDNNFISLNDTVSITWFGCVGDSVFNNTDILESIIAVGFKRIHIPDGVFRLDVSTLNNRNHPDPYYRGLMIRTGTSVTGNGTHRSILLQDGVVNGKASTYYGVFVCQGDTVTNVFFNGFTIKGKNWRYEKHDESSSISEAIGIIFHLGADYNTVDSCKFEGLFGHGVLDVSNGLGSGGYNTVTRCMALYTSKNGFNMNAPHTIFKYNYGFRNHFSLLEASFGHSEAAYNIAVESGATGMGIGGYVDSAEAARDGGYNYIHHNIIRGTVAKGLAISAGCSNSYFYENQIYNNGDQGIVITEQLNDYPGVYTRNNWVFKNTVYDNGRIGASAAIGIFVQAPDNFIFDNIITNTGSGTYRQLHGILFSSLPYEVSAQIWNNVIKGHSIGDLYLRPKSSVLLDTSFVSTYLFRADAGRMSSGPYLWSQVEGNLTMNQTNLYNVTFSNIKPSTSHIVKVDVGGISDLLKIKTFAAADVSIGNDTTVSNLSDFSLKAIIRNLRVGISNFQWHIARAPNPTFAKLVNMSSSGATLTGLAFGVYNVRFVITDQNGCKFSDDIQINVVSPDGKETFISPVAVAGPDKTVVLPANSVEYDGRASYDPDGVVTSYVWSQIKGPNSAGTPSSTSSVSRFTNLVQGLYTFVLTVKDNSGLTGKDTFNVTVSAAPPPAPNKLPIANAGIDQVVTLPVTSVTLDASASSDPDGSIVSYQWTQLLGPRNATIGSPSGVATSVAGLDVGVFQFRIQVTDNAGAVSSDTVLVTVSPAIPTPAPAPTPAPTPAPNQLPVAVAGNDIVITLPTNNATLNGAASNDPDGTISAYSWSQLSGPGSALISSPGSATTNVSSLVQGVYRFRLVVTDNSGATGADTVSVTVNAAPPPPPAPNRLPVAIAGADQSVRFPINFVALNGNASYDPDGTITSYSWSQISGPGNASIAAPFSASTVVNGFVAGVYSFRLEVKDNSGAIAADTVMVRVQMFQPPIPVAPDTLMVKMPVESVELDGSKSYDPDGSIAAFSWTFVQGPNTPLINAQANPVAKVRNLVEGSYIFTLTLTNDKGLSASKNVKVIVSNSNNRLAIKTLSVYPNPVSGTNATLQLEGDYNDKIYMDIYDLNGRIVSRQEFMKNVPSFRQIIYVSHLTNGLYVVQLRTLMRVLGTVKFQKY
jgi:hypothetical protein